MFFTVLSLFPELFVNFTRYGVIKRAFEQNICQFNLYNPRNYALDAKVDDKPFGGGSGVVMKAMPLHLAMADALEYQKEQGAKSTLRVLLSPQGRVLNNTMVDELISKHDGFILTCGRYRGIDERFIASDIDMEVSLGDFILSGGEIPAMALMESMIRKLPGVLNDEESIDNDSFTFGHGLLDYPHYTIPRECMGRGVPDILLSGDHKKIANWRQRMSLENTCNKRPDLLSSEPVV